MTIRTAKLLFRTMTGRYDLVDSAGLSTNGITDILFNEAQRWLDQQVQVKDNMGRRSFACPVGRALFAVRGMQTVTKVTMIYLNSRTELDHMHFDYFLKSYAKFLLPTATDIDPGVNNTDTVIVGCPVHWTIIPTKMSPEAYNMMQSIGTLQGYADAIPGISSNVKTIGIAPPPDTAVEITVWGQLYSDPLNSPDALSYWTEEYPSLLAMTAAYKMEGFYRNKEGASAYMDMMQEQLRGIFHDQVAQDVATYFITKEYDLDGESR